MNCGRAGSNGLRSCGSYRSDITSPCFSRRSATMKAPCAPRSRGISTMAAGRMRMPCRRAASRWRRGWRIRFPSLRACFGGSGSPASVILSRRPSICASPPRAPRWRHAGLCRSDSQDAEAQLNSVKCHSESGEKRSKSRRPLSSTIGINLQSFPAVGISEGLYARYRERTPMFSLRRNRWRFIPIMEEGGWRDLLRFSLCSE